MSRGAGQSGKFGKGPTDSQGQGLGGPGKGRGGKSHENPHPTGLEKTKIPGRMGRGKVVGYYTIRGEPPEGKAGVEFRRLASEAREEALEALGRQKIPASARDYVRDYFDAIRGEGAATPDK